MSNQFRLIRLSDDYPLENIDFDCDDRDLNEFFFKDSIPHLNELLAVTYVAEDETTKEVLGFFCVQNDKLTAEDIKDVRNKIQRKIPNRKRYNTYPCVKIGRFAVNKNVKSRGIGTEMLDYIKVFFLQKNKTGCRFITVDAYAQSTGFYEKMGFIYLTERDKGLETRQMMFDLMPFKKKMDEINRASNQTIL